MSEIDEICLFVTVWLLQIADCTRLRVEFDYCYPARPTQSSGINNIIRSSLGLKLSIPVPNFIQFGFVVSIQM